MRKRLTIANRTTVSYSTWGSGPPLVLVHGAFSDDVTNWEFVKPILEEQFTLYAIARRGRGESDATTGHSLEDEAMDVVALIEAIGEPVFLLGHSYGAHCSLVVADLMKEWVRKLVVYEPARPGLITHEGMLPLERLAQAGEWDEFAFSFFTDLLCVPVAEMEQLRASSLWAPIVGDAKASLQDLKALARYEFSAERFRSLNCPVLLQIGSESPRDLYATDALAAVLPNSRIESLKGQAHEGMTTAPELYAESVTRFVLGENSTAVAATSSIRSL